MQRMIFFSVKTNYSKVKKDIENEMIEIFFFHHSIIPLKSDNRSVMYFFFLAVSFKYIYPYNKYPINIKYI